MGAEGSSRRFIELATKDTRVQGVRMFVPRTVEGAKKIYNDLLEHYKSMRAIEAEYEAEISKRNFKTEDDFAEWLRDCSKEVSRNLKKIGDEYLEEVGGEKWDIDDAELERRENLWIKNNLHDLQRLYGAKIETPAKPAGEYGAEGNGGSFTSRSQLSQSMKEVRAQYTNADKTMRLDYMRAPNGNATNLTEAQWLQFRTPEFKEKYGDWEELSLVNSAMDFLHNTPPVKVLTGMEFQKDGIRLTDKVSAYFDSIGNVAHNKEIGDVVLDLNGIKDSISHGVGRLKSAAFEAVPNVIENGFIFNKETNWKNRNYDTAVIVAPVKIGAEDYICEVVVKRDAKRTAFYLHEVEIKGTLEDMFKTTTEGAISRASKLILGKHIAEVKKKDIKIPLDENGEPIPEVVQPDGEFGAEGYEGAVASFVPYGKNDPIGKRIGSVDPQGRFAPERFAPESATHASDAVEAYRKLNDMVKIADDINGGTPPELAAKLASQIDVWKTKLDPKMLNLPDLVELANSLMTQPVGIRRRMGRALGVFEHSPYSSTIKIRTDMFEWVNDAERFALAERAADRTLEIASEKMMG